MISHTAVLLKSELIITAGGENIAPVPIEDRIKGEVPFLSNVMHAHWRQEEVSQLPCHAKGGGLYSKYAAR